MEFKENIILSQFSRYKIGGRARYFFAAKNDNEIKESLIYAQDKKLPFFILGGGTNLLISDDGFDGLILKPEIKFIESDGEMIRAGAGVLVSELLNFTIEKSLSGLEWAGGLPGTVGGAVYGNAGAFGGEIKNFIHSVESLDTKTLKKIERKIIDCKFSYRNSIFKEKNKREIILSAVFKLGKGNPADIKKRIQNKISYREARHPLEYPNIGSIFKNVDLKIFPKEGLVGVAKVIKNDPFPVVPTAYLISESGLKGVSFGGAMISPKHPNFIVNVLDAKASEVKSLIELVKFEVKKKFGVELEQEVRFL